MFMRLLWIERRDGEGQGWGHRGVEVAMCRGSAHLMVRMDGGAARVLVLEHNVVNLLLQLFADAGLRYA